VRRAAALHDIANLVSQCSLSERVYQRRYGEADGLPPEGSDASQHQVYRNALRGLYVEVLTFQATCACFLSKSATGRVTENMTEGDIWDALLSKIKAKDARLRDIEAQWKDITYQQVLDGDHRLRISQHKETVQGLRGMEDEVIRLRKVIDDAQINADRRSLLESLTTIQPSSNYDLAREEHCGSRTNGWLFVDNPVFATWKTTPSSMLWIHGKGSIPFLTAFSTPLSTPGRANVLSLKPAPESRF